jgi:hypothetical protein
MTGAIKEVLMQQREEGDASVVRVVPNHKRQVGKNSDMGGEWSCYLCSRFLLTRQTGSTGWGFFKPRSLDTKDIVRSQSVCNLTRLRYLVSWTYVHHEIYLVYSMDDDNMFVLAEETEKKSRLQVHHKVECLSWMSWMEKTLPQCCCLETPKIHPRLL